jgi:hypothetical protein
VGILVAETVLGDHPQHHTHPWPSFQPPFLVHFYRSSIPFSSASASFSSTHNNDAPPASLGKYASIWYVALSLHAGQPVFAVTRKPTSTRLARCRNRRLVLSNHTSTSHHKTTTPTPFKVPSPRAICCSCRANPSTPAKPSTSFNSNPDQSRTH